MIQTYSILTSTRSTTPRPYLHPCSLSQWAHGKAGSFLFGMLALQTCIYEENVMAGSDSTENALEARSQAGRLQADEVWIRKTRSPGTHELSSAEWLQLLRDVPEDMPGTWHECSGGRAPWEIESFMPLWTHWRTNIRLPPGGAWTDEHVIVGAVIAFSSRGVDGRSPSTDSIW